MVPQEKIPAVEVHDLVVKYKKFEAVRGISFFVRSGEVFGLLGPNGAGKTSIIKAITTLRKISGGTVRIHGIDVTRSANESRKIISLVSQENSLDVMLNVYDNLYFYAWVQRIPRRLRKEKAEALLDFFGLKEKKKALVTSLSGGQFRRLQLAKIFLCDARVYFLDEPSLGLDYRIKQSFWKFLKDTCRESGTSCVIATNDLAEAERVCDRIAFLDSGKIVALDSPVELSRMLDRTMIEVQFEEGIEVTPTLVRKFEDTYGRIESISEQGIRFHYKQNGTLLSQCVQEFESMGRIRLLSVRPPNLQDIFMELNTKREN